MQPGEDEYTVVPNSEFVVSRTAFKDNSSNYSINGKRATYKEVGNLLRGNGIDLDHNRFLILQVIIEGSFQGMQTLIIFLTYNVLILVKTYFQIPSCRVVNNSAGTVNWVSEIYFNVKIISIKL